MLKFFSVRAKRAPVISVCPNTKTKNLMEICLKTSMHLHCEFYGLKTCFEDFFFKILSMFKLKTQLERERET